MNIVIHGMLLIIFAKSSVLDLWLGSKYASGISKFNDTHRENSVIKYNLLNSVQEWLLGYFWPFSYVYTIN